MIRRPWTGSRPKELAITFDNRNVIDARLAAPHQAVLIEFPQVVTVTAMPVAASVVPLVLKSHRNPVVGECPQRFD